MVCRAPGLVSVCCLNVEFVDRLIQRRFGGCRVGPPLQSSHIEVRVILCKLGIVITVFMRQLSSSLKQFGLQTAQHGDARVRLAPARILSVDMQGDMGSGMTVVERPREWNDGGGARRRKEGLR